MITVQFKDTFRDRLPEWITSICLVVWGLIVINAPTTLWDEKYFGVLADIAMQRTWGIIATSVGVFRIIALIINGAWRPTAHIRALGAMLGMLIWTGIIVSYLALPWSPPALATKTAMFFLDLSALWFAAGDAKIVDTMAKQQLNALKSSPLK